jgi:hypothetical protein
VRWAQGATDLGRSGWDQLCSLARGGRGARGVGVEITPDPLRDFFLRATATDVFLDATLPTVTSAEFKNPAPVHFAGGDPSKEMGTWRMTMA